ncbi:unnamed protein product, partial [Allacma fusca]
PNVLPGHISELEKLKANCNNSYFALKTLKRDNTLGEDFIVKIILRKLDPETRKDFKKSLPDRDVPSLSSFNQFIDKLVADHATENSEISFSAPKQQSSRPYEAKNFPKPNRTPTKCSFCQGEHLNYTCKLLLDKPTADRLTYAKDSKVCTNCLSPNHSTKDCQSKKVCRKCSKNHHTLLHKDITEAGSKPKAHANTVSLPATSSNTLLATAMVQVRNKYGQPWESRALIDNGSTHTFINSSLVTTLGLKRKLLPNPMQVNGLSDVHITMITHTVEIDLTSEHYPDTVVTTTALIVEKAAGLQPSSPIVPQEWKHIRDLTLADPTFFKTRAVNLLIGTDIYPRILHGGMKKGRPDQPLAQDTMFGWIISGPTTSAGPSLTASLNNNCALDITLRKFWEIEECNYTKRLLTMEETKCEQHYLQTTRRNSDGSFVVQLPFKDITEPLGNSKNMAFKRFLNLEAKFQHNRAFKDQYCQQIQELIQDGHLELIPPADDNLKVSHLTPTKLYFLPHHGVSKESSTTTKLRIVFDASAVTTSGQSLNQQLMVGPVLQEDLVSILIRWRHWKIPMTADIKQMYLYIWMREEDRDFLRILWRSNPKDPIMQYRLTKVTFGTSCAHFQAVKTLQELGKFHRNEFPLASLAVSRDFYVDDCLTGSNSEEDAIKLQKELLNLTEKGGFVLRKWSSSSTKPLQQLPDHLRESQQPLTLGQDDSIKTLGLLWNPASDEFSFTNQPPKSAKVTKRTVLSEIARIFDPLGFLTPVTIRAKILMQRLWTMELGWDNVLPTPLLDEWHSLQKEISSLETIRIPRWISQTDNSLMQLHGFSDASTKAYAAVVYLRTISPQGIVVRLITSKTRVAPIKMTSIPRLKLCAAELLANLMEVVRHSLPDSIQEHFGWTDSIIVWSWIRSQAQSKEIFFANRVIKIQQRMPPECWHHVPGTLNPADLPSCGISGQELQQSSRWFNGPDFLQTYAIQMPPQPVDPSRKVPLGNACTSTTGYQNLSSSADSPRRDPQGDVYTPSVDIHCISFASTNASTHPGVPEIAVAHLATTSSATIIANKYSNFNRLLRHTVWWNRLWSFFLKRPGCLQQSTPITAPELIQARQQWIWATQQEGLKTEFKSIQREGQVPPKSPLRPLAPFIDPKDEIIKAGGRLHNSNLPSEFKHPTILPRHRITYLITWEYHHNLLHAGPSLLWHMMRRRYWIVKFVLHLVDYKNSKIESAIENS